MKVIYTYILIECLFSLRLNAQKSEFKKVKVVHSRIRVLLEGGFGSSYTIDPEFGPFYPELNQKNYPNSANYGSVNAEFFLGQKKRTSSVVTGGGLLWHSYSFRDGQLRKYDISIKSVVLPIGIQSKFFIDRNKRFAMRMGIGALNLYTLSSKNNVDNGLNLDFNSLTNKYIVGAYITGGVEFANRIGLRLLYVDNSFSTSLFKESFRGKSNFTLKLATWCLYINLIK